MYINNNILNYNILNYRVECARLNFTADREHGQMLMMVVVNTKTILMQLM